MVRFGLSAAALVGALAAGAAGQSLNIDFGLPNSGPSASYGAAGLPGVWNSIEATHTSISNPQFVYPLVGLNGAATTARLNQFGGTELLTTHDPAVSGDDAILLDDCILTHTQNLETCLFINGLQDGMYEVLTYAWRPLNPGVTSRVRFDFNGNLVDVGGAWSGHHVEGVTFARHFVQVTSGYMGVHSGNIPGGNLTIGAALNGIQLRLLGACPAAAIVGGVAGESFTEHAFDGYIDPRIESNNGVDVNLGMDSFTVVFNTPMRDADGSGLSPESFSITQTGGGTAPHVVQVESEDGVSALVRLNRPLTLGQWTTLTTSAVSLCSGEAIIGSNQLRFGYLPGDVDQSSLVNPVDLLRFRQMVNGLFTPARGVAADYIDTDRSGSVTPIDLLRYRQLINGIPPATRSWAGAALPS